MSQNMMDHDSSQGIAESNTNEARGLRDLTYDQKKAAEAAFRGDPFNPAWSAAAATVYEGIVSAMSRMQIAALTEVEVTEECLTR
jgi:hypothetical protein